MKNIFFISIAAAIVLFSCTKEWSDFPTVPKSWPEEYRQTPYTYLQNKYLDSVLRYELAKQNEAYNSGNYSLDEKMNMICQIDSLKETSEFEPTDDVSFYESLSSGLIAEINNHPYIQEFVSRFAQKDNYDANDILVYTGTSDCFDAISKFQILKNYEDGIDVIPLFSIRSSLTGEETNDLDYSNSFSTNTKGARYSLHAKWGNTIEYMWNTSSPTIRSSVLSAMSDWRKASNYKISFSEITKNINWNKTCWLMGWKYFIRISHSNSTNYAGRSSIGKVPWAILEFTNGAYYPRTYQHELGHSLGLIHEHQRNDRDNYITYHKENVSVGNRYNFSKMPASSCNYYGTFFDFNSVMLYGSYSGNLNNKKALTKKDGSVFLGGSQISDNDKAVIRQIYN